MLSSSDKQPNTVNQNQIHTNTFETKMGKNNLWMSRKAKSSNHRRIDSEPPYNRQRFEREGKQVMSKLNGVNNTPNIKETNKRKLGKLSAWSNLQRIEKEINSVPLEKPVHVADIEVWEQMNKYFPFVSNFTIKRFK